jgi:hypothetical protein
MIFDIESKKAVIISNLSKNLWLIALILFSLFAVILLKVPAIGTAQVENFSDNSTLTNETLAAPDIVNDTINETIVNDTGIVNETIANETIVDENRTNEFVNNTTPPAVLINDTELNITKSKFIVSIQGDTSVPLISFTSPTPADGAITANTSIITNISITNASELNQFIWNWNGTNYTFYDNSLDLMMNFDNVSAIGENSTKVVDVSSNSVNGTVFNAVFNATGKYGGAYKFNGVNAWINGTKMATNAVNNWAISAWIKPASLPQGGSASDLIVYNGNDGGGYGLGIGNGAGLAGSKLTGLYGLVAWIDGGYTFASANTWYHVVMTRASGTTYFYVNGIQTANTTAIVPGTALNVLSIGCQLNVSNGPSRYFNGTIDEVQIYNRSLSANEVTQQYYSNLYKYDSDKWIFITNQSTLISRGNYTYQGCANNTLGNNCTETRTIYMGDWAPPGISFTNPTPANGTFTANTFAVINISVTNASDMNEFKWNWNSTNYTFYNSSLELMLNLDNVSVLGESATKAVDVGTSSNNATFYNTPTWTTAGKYNKALNFAGTTYATTTTTGFSASTGTVLMWIKPNKDLRTVTQAFFDTYPSGIGALRIYSNNDNTLRYETGGTLTALAWTIPSNWTGQWHQIGLNWSGSATALIVDGIVVASGSNDKAPAITTFEIGRYNSGSNFNGTIDEVRVYSASLSPGELKQQYYSNLNKYDADDWAFYTNQSNLTAGTYTYQGFAKDVNNNANKTDLNYLYIDLTAPTINFTNPTETSGITLITRNNILVNVTANDTNLANMTIYLFNSTRSLLNATTTATSPNFVNFTSLANGLYYFNATARDAAGNSNSTETRNTTISYDITSPLISVVYPQNTTYNVNVSALNYTVSDANLQACWYSINGGQANTTIICGNNVTGLTSTESSNTWTIWANDTIGNKNSSSVTFNKDTGKPRWSNPTINATTIYNGDSVKFNATWTNAQLAGYIFSIKQNGTYWNSSYIPFSGTTNVSENISLIVAPAGTNVTWFFWANDSAGNANQTSLQSFVIQTIPTSLLFSVNQTLYSQGRSPGYNYTITIPLQARYTDVQKLQTISGAACNVVNDETDEIISLAYNSTTGNYTGEIDNYLLYDVVSFNATCSKANYVSATNTTSTNVWWFGYLWEWENRSYGFSPSQAYDTHWIRKQQPFGASYILAKNMSLNSGENKIWEFMYQGAGTNNSVQRDYTTLHLQTLRLNISINDTTCKPYLCFKVRDSYLNLIYRDCGAEQLISANLPIQVENNISDNITVRQNDYVAMSFYLNCTANVSEEIGVYYNYTGQQANLQMAYAKVTLVKSYLSGYVQHDSNYTIGPNRAVNSTGEVWITFNNTFSTPHYLDYLYIAPILADYPNSLAPGTFYVYNYTGGLWASDNASAGAPNNITLYSEENKLGWTTETFPGNTALNESIKGMSIDTLRDVETLNVNLSTRKVWTIVGFGIAPALYASNVTFWTNYSAYGVPNDWNLQVNITNSSGTFDITSSSTINATLETITFPQLSLFLGSINYTVTAGDMTPPTVHLISPQNGTLTNQSTQTFLCNITNTEIANLTLNILNSSSDNIYSNTTLLSGVFNSTNWTFTLPYDNSFKWNCLGYDTSGNSNYSSEGNYTITLDRVAPTINVLECTPSQTNINGTVVCNATINDATGINSAKANVTLPNTTVIWATVSNLSSNYYFMFNYTGFQGRYNVTWFANDSLGNSNTSEGYFIASSIPSVVIISPHGEVFDQRTHVPILTNVSDNGGIDSAISQVTLPDGTKVNITLGTGQESDNFDADSMGIKWVGENSTVNEGQNCVVDIDTTASGAARTSISGSGMPYTDAYCSILSKKAVAGNFDISVSFNATNFTGSDMAINLVLTEEPTSIVGINQIFMSLGNWTGTGKEYQLYVIATNFSDFVSRRNTDDTYGKFRITRVNDTFKFYTWNSSSWFEENMSQHNFSLNKALYITLQSETSVLNWGTASVNWDNLIINSSNYTFGMFPDTNLTGNYNVTIIANSTLGTLNNTEKTNFTIEYINSPPTVPFVLYPNANSIISGVKNITWSNVLDKEQDSLQFNVTLLNTDYSFNSTIASNYGNNQSTKYLWNTALRQDGDYSLKVMVFENATAERLSRSNTLYGSFTIDNTPPAIQFVAPTPASGSAQRSADILINVTASDSSLSLIRAYVYDSSHVMISYLESSTSPANFNFSGYADGLYYFNATATDTLSNLNSTETRNVTIDTIPPNITSTFTYPYDPAVGYNITFNATATDNIGISGIFVNITLPNTTVITRTLPMANYTLQMDGRHNVTFWANDTAGNVGTSSADYFIAGVARVPVQFNIINNNSEGLTVNLTIYFTGTDKEVNEHNFTGIYTDVHTTLLYDLHYQALDGNISVRLNEVNLSLDNNRTIGLDRFTSLTGYLVTYGINSTYNFTNATLVLSYAGTGYTNQNYLGLYKCSNWNFTARECDGTWVAVSGTQDKTVHTFSLPVTSFSGYSIKQESVPPSPPSPPGPSEGAPYPLILYKFNVSITGNCTGKDVILKVINQKLNATGVSGVNITVTYGSNVLALVTNTSGMTMFKPSIAGNYTFEFKKNDYTTEMLNYTIYSCPAAVPEKEKPVVLIEYKPEVYKETKSPILTTVALILAGLLVLFIVLKIAVMRRRDREFHHKFNMRHAHVHNGRLIIHRHS